MLRKAASVLVIVSMLVLLGGCWDRTEINDVAFVIATAYDKEEDEYRVSFQFPLVGQLGAPGGGGGGTRGEKGWYMDSATGATIREADDHQQQSLSRQLYFGHRRVLIFGESLARDNIAPVTDITARLPENRLTALAVVSKGPGRDILNAESTVERIPSEMIRELVIQTMGRPITMKLMIDNLKSDGVDLMLPAVEMTKSQPGPLGKPESTIEFISMGVFAGNRLVDFLDEETTLGLLISSGQINTPHLTLTAPGNNGKMTMRLMEIDQQIEVTSMAPYTFELGLRARGGVVENQSKFDLNQPTDLMKVEELMNDYLSALVERTIAELKRLHSDPLGFGDVLYRHDPGHWHEIRESWRQDIYPHIEVDVNAEVHVELPGSLIHPTREGVSQ